MTHEEQEFILKLSTSEISQEDFLKKFGASRQEVPLLIERLLRESFKEADEDGIDCALLVGFVFGFGVRHIQILCELSDADGHHSHEDIVSALDELRTPRATDVFFRAIQARHKYLDFDDAHALAVKALYALSNLNTESAREKIRLATHSDVPRIAEQARERLRELKTDS